MHISPRVFEGYTVFYPLLRKRQFASVIDSIDFLYSLMALFLMNGNFSVMRFLSSLLKLALKGKCFSQVIIFSLFSQAVFEGIRGRGYRGDIAIDDTNVQSGPCPPPGSCDFEKGLCAYQNDLVDDVFDWERNSGHTGSIGTGPSVDHTTNSVNGNLVVL